MKGRERNSMCKSSESRVVAWSLESKAMAGVEGLVQVVLPSWAELYDLTLRGTRARLCFGGRQEPGHRLGKRGKGAWSLLPPAYLGSQDLGGKWPSFGMFSRDLR